MEEKNPFLYSSVLVTNRTLNNKLHQEEEKKFYIKKGEPLTFRKIPRLKSAIIIQAEKELKRVTLSSQSFSNYMKRNKSVIREFAFNSKKKRTYSSINNLVRRRNQSQKIINKNLPNLTHKKSDTTEFSKDGSKKMNHYKSEKNMEININMGDNVLHENTNSNEENENYKIEEMPYGFKYKNTRIILDKDKIGPIKSAIFPEDDNNDINNDEVNYITNRKEIKKEKPKNYRAKSSLKKKEEEKNKTFNFFFDGDFLQKNKKVLKKKNKNEFVLKYEEANDYLSELYDIFIGTNVFNGKDFSRQMKYNIKNNNHTEEYAYELYLNSLCLKFIEQNKNKNIDENTKKNSHKVYLPFTYLFFFYLLDFETFKIFLSEILIFNEKKGQMEINQNKIKDIIKKYKKYIKDNLDPYFKKGKKDIENYEFYQKASYNWNEHNFLKIYDWIVNINSDNDNTNFSNNQDKNKKIIYKVKIILPRIKFNLITKKIVIKKLIHKNIIISLLKQGLNKWEKKILCELFFNKKFRYIINGIFSKKNQNSHSYKKRKIYIDKTDYNINILNRHKYEFFITDAKREFSRYLYISSYEILFFYGRNKDKFNINRYMSIKDSINLNKYSIYWGYTNTIMKCLYIDNKEKKVIFDFKILENDPKEFFQLKLKTKVGLGVIDKNNSENLKSFYNNGYIKYREEKLLVDMYFINFIFVEPCISNYILQKYKFRIPKELLDIIIENKNAFNNLNFHISDFSEEILSSKEILNINYNDIKHQVDGKNLSKGVKERLSRFTLGLIDKSNIIRIPSSFMNADSDIKKTTSNFKRGVSTGGKRSLFVNSLHGRAETYKKSETKKFGGSVFFNNINEEKKIMDNKNGRAKQLLNWKRLNSLQKPEENSEMKEIKEIQEKKYNRQISFFNPVKKDDSDNNNNDNDIGSDKDSIKDEEIEDEKEKEKERLRKFRKMNTKMKSKFIQKGEYFKKYIDDKKKQAEVKYIDIDGKELFK